MPMKAPLFALMVATTFIIAGCGKYPKKVRIVRKASLPDSQGAPFGETYDALLNEPQWIYREDVKEKDVVSVEGVIKNEGIVNFLNSYFRQATPNYRNHLDERFFPDIAKGWMGGKLSDLQGVVDDLFVRYETYDEDFSFRKDAPYSHDLAYKDTMDKIKRHRRLSQSLAEYDDSIKNKLDLLVKVHESYVRMVPKWISTQEAQWQSQIDAIKRPWGTVASKIAVRVTKGEQFSKTRKVREEMREKLKSLARSNDWEQGLTAFRDELMNTPDLEPLARDIHASFAEIMGLAKESQQAKREYFEIKAKLEANPDISPSVIAPLLTGDAPLAERAHTLNAYKSFYYPGDSSNFITILVRTFEEREAVKSKLAAMPSLEELQRSRDVIRKTYLRQIASKYVEVLKEEIADEKNWRRTTEFKATVTFEIVTLDDGRRVDPLGHEIAIVSGPSKGTKVSFKDRTWNAMVFANEADVKTLMALEKDTQ